jgi:hypothetical protein
MVSGIGSVGGWGFGEISAFREFECYSILEFFSVQD